MHVEREEEDRDQESPPPSYQQQELYRGEYGSSRRQEAEKAGMRDGEIVEVQGGHIVRSTGRKDRHSKVCTAKGTRDRRVRLSALTAIQFYDVQDRLGYDRPSKAVDWLITKAKSSIAHLPPWDPRTSTAHHHNSAIARQVGAGHGETSLNPHSTSSSFLLPSMESFFPMAPQSQFHNYPPDLVSSSQDLRLSLHSFQDQNLQHQHEQSLFSGTAHLGFDAEMGRLVSSSWNNAGADNSGAFTFTTPLGSQNQYISQRRPLQSNNTPWMDHTSGHQFPFQSSIGFPFSGAFHIPTREEEHSNKPSSASSD